MKNGILFIIVLFAFCSSCKSLNFTVDESILLDSIKCPKNGVCTLELIPNKSLEFKSDEFGISYPVISEGEKTIFKYTYQRNPAPNTQDSNYTEIIYAELAKTITEISLTNNDLQQVKLYFGRLCYCKGETGYFPIKEGKFKITKFDKNALKIAIEFNVTEVPQIITKIEEVISLKSN